MFFHESWSVVTLQEHCKRNHQPVNHTQSNALSHRLVEKHKLMKTVQNRYKVHKSFLYRQQSEHMIYFNPKILII